MEVVTGTSLASMPARRVECRFYQSRATSAAKQLELTARGIELLSVHTGNATLAGSALPATVRDKHADVIPWSDVLGASVLSDDALVHVPGYKPKPAADPRTDFVVFGCIPKSSAIKKSVFATGLQALVCFGGSSDAPDDSPADASDKKRKRSSVPASGACDRVLVQWVFRYSAADASTLVSELVQAIQRYADPRTHAELDEPDAESAIQTRKRNYLVLVNPAGGTGSAKQLYETTAAPLLYQSNIACDVVVTEFQHQAVEIAASLPLGKYDCVVAVGGDGLLSEVVQGLMKRSDWRDAIRQPLGILPAGSGNGLSATLLHRSNESFDFVNAAYALAKGTVQELDIASVVNGKDDVMYSFLSLAWAFMADVDIESERYRMFGGSRFTMSAVAKLLSKHKDYTGTVRYLCSDNDTSAPPKYHDRSDHVDSAMRPTLDCLTGAPTEDSASAPVWKELAGPYHMFWGVNVSHTGAQGYLAPAAHIDDGYYYLLVVAGAYSRLNMTRMLLGLEDGTHVGKKQVQIIRTRAFTMQVDNPADRLCVDGELFDGPELKVEVHRALGRMVRRESQIASRALEETLPMDAPAAAMAWDTRASRSLECRYYQHGRRSSTSAKRLQLSRRGIELRPLRSESLSPSSPPTLIQWRDVLSATVLSPEVAALVPGYALSPPSAAAEQQHALEFVVFGCLPQADALAWTAQSGGLDISSVGGTLVGYLGSLLSILTCFGRGSDMDEPIARDHRKPTDVVTATPIDVAPEAAPSGKSSGSRSGSQTRVLCERMLVQWVFRYTGDDAATYVPRVVQAIERLADPRIAHAISPLGGRELPQLSQRRYLVFVNPAGGAGRAQQLVDTVVAPVLTQSNVAFDVVTTQYQYHASEVVMTLPLDKYDCIVAVGGDGLLSEIVQGLMKRPDWRDAIQHPLGIVPGGSGNGLAASLLHRSGEAMDALNATYALVKGAVHELDLSSVRNSRGDTMYSFLSLEWAFIADVDVESERYRMFGGLRFTLSSIVKLLSRYKEYSGTLRYLSSDNDVHMPPKFHEQPRDASASAKEAETRPPLVCAAPTEQSQLPVPSQDASARGDWKTISGSFHMFWAMNVSHAASDGHIAPPALADDGYYYLMLMAGPFSRRNLVKLLFGIEDGSHIGKPQVELIRTRAFTLELANASDVLCVDGERFHGPELQVEVHRALGRVLCLPERR